MTKPPDDILVLYTLLVEFNLIVLLVFYSTDVYYIYDGFQPFPTTLPFPNPAQAAAGWLTTCRLAASHKPVLHGRHAEVWQSGKLENANFLKFCSRVFLRFWCTL